MFFFQLVRINTFDFCYLHLKKQAQNIIMILLEIYNGALQELSFKIFKTNEHFITKPHFYCDPCAT